MLFRSAVIRNLIIRTNEAVTEPSPMKASESREDRRRDDRDDRHDDRDEDDSDDDSEDDSENNE